MSLRTVALMAALILVGCAAPWKADNSDRGAFYNVHIQATSYGEEPLRRYVVLSGKDIEPETMVFREASRYLEHVLDEHGFVPAGSSESADVFVFLSYDIEPLNAESTKFRRANSGVRFVGGARDEQAASGYGRRVAIEAQDKEQKKLWRTLVVSVGSSNDLRRAMPALIAAAGNHLDSNTPEPVAIKIFENDPVVRRARGEISAVEEGG